MYVCVCERNGRERERVTGRDVSVGGGPVCSYAILPREEELFGSVYFNT